MTDQEAAPPDTRRTVTLVQMMLGLQPYVLIEADTDPEDDELIIKVNAGGGVEPERIGHLPLLMLTQLPAEQNPLTEAVEHVLAGRPESRDILANFAEYVGFPMPGADPS